MKWFCLVLLLGVVWAQADVHEHLKTFWDTFGEENKIDDLLKTRCTELGGAEAFGTLEDSITELSEYVQNNFNSTLIESEVSLARKERVLEEVFSKYCTRVPTAMVYVNKIVANLENCLKDGEKSSLRLILNITENLSEFFCYKDGDRIALFIDEGGVECMESQKEKLDKCYTDISNEIDFSNYSLDNLPNLADNTEGCYFYAKFQNCTVTAFENCDDSTPANIIDTLFKFVRHLTPCNDYKSPSLALVILDK